MMLCENLTFPMGRSWLGYTAVAFAFISENQHA